MHFCARFKTPLLGSDLELTVKAQTAELSERFTTVHHRRLPRGYITAHIR